MHIGQLSYKENEPLPLFSQNCGNKIDETRYTKNNYLRKSLFINQNYKIQIILQTFDRFTKIGNSNYLFIYFHVFIYDHFLQVAYLKQSLMAIITLRIQSFLNKFLLSSRF